MRPVTLSRGLGIMEQIHKRSDTARWYKIPINELIKMFGDVPVRAITPEQMDEYFDAISSRGLSRWTVNSYTRAVKSFFGHMINTGHISQSPAAHLKPPRPPRSNPKDITDDEVRALIRASKRNRRDYAMICVLRDTGCRVGGLVSMTVDTLDIRETEKGKRGKIIVVEKGDKPRHVYVKDEACNALLDYLEIRPVFAPPDLWLNRSDKPLTPSGIYHILRNTAKRAGVTTFNPHAFRHRFCKKLVEAGTPHKVIQDLLGWESQEMVQIYVVHTESELQAYHEQYVS